MKKKLISTMLGTALCISLAAAVPTLAVSLTADTPVDVTGGQITGTTSEDGEVVIYKGIPYAAAPTGELRWKDPQPVEAWEGVKECDTFSDCAVQNPPMKEWDLEAMPWKAPFVGEYDLDPDNDTFSEDCLYLNVWTKAEDEEENKPVIVYIHGGGYGEGSGSIRCYDGTKVAENGAVYVTINYRIGVFGFLTTPELDAESETGTSGNYGLLDTVAALQWVHDNIAQFGGDPGNVTIVGQSAGGMSIHFMIASPLAEGLFQHAVVLSGNYIRVGRDSSVTSKDTLQQAFAEEYPDVTLEQLREMPTDEVYANYRLAGNVCVDGYVLTDDVTNTMTEGKQNKADVLLSTVEGDIFSFFMPNPVNSLETYNTWVTENFGEYADTVFELYPVSDDDSAEETYIQLSVDRQLATYLMFADMNENAGKNAYVCYFDHVIPGEQDCGAFHTGDVPYWLGGAFTTRVPYLTDVDYNLCDTMVSYLVNFAKNGDPNSDATAEWEAHDGSYRYLYIGDDTYEETEISQEKGDFWMNWINETSLGSLTK